MKSLSIALMALALPLAAASLSWAECDCGASVIGDGCGSAASCGVAGPSCGCDAGCAGGCKVCKLVRTEFEVTSICYGTKCKDICIPGCGSKCTDVACVKCGKCNCSCGTTGASCKVRYPTGKPGCAKRIKTVQELVKYEVRKKVCGYKWVVVNAGSCDGCDAGCDGDGGCGCAASGSGCGCTAAAGCAVPGA